MHRGGIIAGIVLVAVIGLFVARHIGESERPLEAVGAEAGGPAPDSPAVGETAETAAGNLPATGETRAYTIDAAGSEVYWRIYRSGPARRLGHSHVISVGELAGSVSLGSDPAAATWQLSFPVAGLVVDDPGLRARHGEEFESVPSEEDKAGTKENMLTDRVLDGAQFPEIRLDGTGFVGPLQDATLAVSIHMLGRTIDRSVPASIVIGADELTVSGEFRLTHEDLGLEPFTALGGMMAVGEDIDFTYRIRALAGDR